MIEANLVGINAQPTRGYLPIGAYALIGDTQTTALVATDGAIDWCCLPHVDSPAIFCRLLDASRGGYFRIGPIGGYSTARRYLDDTNVLQTQFDTDTGRLWLTDLMAIEAGDALQPHAAALPTHDVLRLVEVPSGEVEIEVEFYPTFDYARQSATIDPVDRGVMARAGRECVLLHCPIPLKPDAAGVWRGRARLAAGSRLWLTLAYFNGDTPTQAFAAEQAEQALTRTLNYWRRWLAQCRYDGMHNGLVRRSALALKLLTFSPTGAIVAAPTTSLPEQIGGVRNWDYRYTWLRDSALILFALQSIGFHEEADAFFDWMINLCVHCRDRLQPLYSVRGEEYLAEQTLDHLEGYCHSRPVRIGNAAAQQLQLDIYGQVLDAAHLHAETRPSHMQQMQWDLLGNLASRALRRWREPDLGLWEIRGPPRHFLYSKLMCWVALDRAVRLARRHRFGAEVEHWRRACNEIRSAIEQQGYNQKLGAFTQAFDNDALDASALTIPLVGFLSPTDPRVRSTVARIRERLTADGLVYRYVNAADANDGLPGDEATFALCSFWMVDNLALGGQLDAAHELFERVTRYANDVGLLAEEFDPAGSRMLGNFPQGFTHLGLIGSAVNLAKARRYGTEVRAETRAERQAKAADALRHKGASDA